MEKELLPAVSSSSVEAKVRRVIKEKLALPLKQKLIVSCQDCHKASMTT